jgi:hypothetical protein
MRKYTEKYFCKEGLNKCATFKNAEKMIKTSIIIKQNRGPLNEPAIMMFSCAEHSKMCTAADAAATHA